MNPEFVIRQKCSIFWANRVLRVYFDLYAANFPKSTMKFFFLLLSTCLKYLGKQKITVLFFFRMWSLYFKKYPETAIELKYGLFYFNNEVRVHTLSLVCWLEKVLTRTKYFLDSLTHTNQKLPSYIYCAKIWCILYSIGFQTIY